MSLLIVEDDPSTCDLLTRFFMREGFEVECANTLLEGMLRIAGRPCGVLLDLGLPDGSGLELLRFVRDGKLGIPVAVVTGQGGATAADAAMLHPDALFTKPVDIPDVLSWVRRVCPCV